MSKKDMGEKQRQRKLQRLTGMTTIAHHNEGKFERYWVVIQPNKNAIAEIWMTKPPAIYETVPIS